MPVMVDAYVTGAYGGNQLTLPHPIFVASEPANGSTLNELDPVHSFWRKRFEDWYSMDVLGFSFDSFPASVLALTGGVYDAAADVGLFPEESRVVVLRANTTGGYTALVLIGFATRGGFGGLIAPGVIGSAYRGSLGLLAEISKYIGGFSSSLADIRSRDAAGSSAASELTVSVNGGGAGSVASIAAGLAGGSSGRITLTPFGLSSESFEASMFVMTLGGGAADAMKARLTIKLDFLQLLALRSTGVSREDGQAIEATAGLRGDMEPGGEALQLLRVAGFQIIEGTRASVEVTRETITEMLRSAGAGREIIEEALRGFEASGGGGGLLVEIDLLDAILDEGR